MQGEGTVAEVLAGEARFAVVCGDAAEVLPTIGDGTVAAVVTDPPAGINFMSLAFDSDRGGRAQWVAWLAGILADARRCTRDGGRSVVWSLPRTSHWTGCAVEDAGWSIENTVTHLFGTGWPKGKSQLKPAAETWWLARNGRSSSLNVEACRVGATKRVPSTPPSAPNAIYGARPASAATGDSDGYNPNVGRYPPNVVLSHAPGCVCAGTRRVATGGSGVPAVTKAGVNFSGDEDRRGSTAHPCHRDADGREEVEAWECAEGCPVAELDAQSGERTSGVKVGGNYSREVGIHGGGHRVDGTSCFGDTGTASRYFPQFPADPAVFRYVAKPSSAEKEEGVGVEARGLAAVAHKRCAACGRQEVNVRGAECRCSSPCWVQPDVARVASNDHPTVKSIALMRWLVDLVTQRGDLVLDPFAGSGTTGVACLASGRRVILVERDPRFAEIARQRCAHWGAEWSALAKVSQRKARAAKGDEVQPSLFGDGSR